jgi:hypothetical protein
MPVKTRTAAALLEVTKRFRVGWPNYLKALRKMQKMVWPAHRYGAYFSASKSKELELETKLAIK